MVQWIFLTCFLKSPLDTHLGAEPLWTAATSPKWLHMISHFHVTPRWFSNHSKFSDDAEWGSLRSDSSWCCHCCHQKDQSTEEEPQRPEGIHAGSAVQGRCWIRGWGNGRRILRWLQVYFLFVRNRLLHWPWCAGTHRLLGSARIERQRRCSHIQQTPSSWDQARQGSNVRDNGLYRPRILQVSRCDQLFKLLKNHMEPHMISYYDILWHDDHHLSRCDQLFKLLKNHMEPHMISYIMTYHDISRPILTSYVTPWHDFTSSFTILT